MVRSVSSNREGQSQHSNTTTTLTSPFLSYPDVVAAALAVPVGVV